MNKEDIIHSVFETINNKRTCVAVYLSNGEAQDCITRRKKWTGGTYDIKLFVLGEEK